MVERESHCVNRCPACGSEQHEGYDDLDFAGDAERGMFAMLRFHCGECGQEYFEQYSYHATWHEEEGE